MPPFESGAVQKEHQSRSPGPRSAALGAGPSFLPDVSNTFMSGRFTAYATKAALSPPSPSPGCREALPARCKPGRESRTSWPRFEEKKGGKKKVCGANVTRRGIWAGAALAPKKPRVAAGPPALEPGERSFPGLTSIWDRLPKPLAISEPGCVKGAQAKKDRTWPQLPLMRSL